jgi:hypothetical protein
MLHYSYGRRTTDVAVYVASLTLETRVREVCGLHVGRGTSYPDRFRDFPQSVQANSGVVPRLGHDRFFSRDFPIHNVSHRTIRRDIIWLLTASLSDPQSKHSWLERIICQRKTYQCMNHGRPRPFLSTMKIDKCSPVSVCAVVVM